MREREGEREKTQRKMKRERIENSLRMILKVNAIYPLQDYFTCEPPSPCTSLSEQRGSPLLEITFSKRENTYSKGSVRELVFTSLSLYSLNEE